MRRVRLATPDDADEPIRLRLDFLEEAGNLKAGADGGELGAAMRGHLARKMPSGELLARVAESECAKVATGGVKATAAADRRQARRRVTRGAAIFV